MSETDVGAGTRWQTAIASELDVSQFGILALAPDNLTSNWIHFEAGALAKQLGAARVCPILLEGELSLVREPLGQFQAKRANRSGIRDLIGAVNAQCPMPIAAENLDGVFAKWWPDLEGALVKIPKATIPPPARRAEDLLEEILDNTRSIAMHHGVELADNPIRRMEHMMRLMRQDMRALAETIPIDDEHDGAE